MNRLMILLIGVMICSGCAFKSISDTCDLESGGNGCTPIAGNLQQTVERAAERKATEEITTPKVADIAMQNDYTEIDKDVITDEYRRAAPRSMAARPLNSTEVKIRIYPYSDGEHFYDVRDVYILIQRAGWARGSVAYTPEGTVLLDNETNFIPHQMTVVTDVLNVRVGPNAHFESTSSIPKDTTVYPKNYRNGWYYIEATINRGTPEAPEFEIVSGWVHGGYLQ